MPEKRDPRRRSEITRHIEALADWLVETVNKINEAHEGEAPALTEKMRPPSQVQGGQNAGSQPL